MNSVVNELLTLAITFTGVFGYGGIALVMIVAAPELVMPFAGFLVARGDLSFLGVLFAATTGALLSQWAFYAAARTVGERRVLAFARRYGRFLLLSERDVRRSLGLFARFGDPLVVFGRAVPTVRSLISIPAGLQKMPLLRFMLLTALGTALWNALLLYAGTLLGRNWRQVVGVLETYQTLILILLCLGAAALVVRRLKPKPTT